MGLSIVLESQNNFEVGPRPKNPHSLHSSRKKPEEWIVYQSSNAEDRDIEGKMFHKELFLHNPASPSRKSMPSKLIALDIKDGGMAKHSSIYQGSREIRRKLEVRGGKNLKPYLNDGTILSFELINSTPWNTSNESSQFPQPKKEEPVAPLHLEPKSPSFGLIQSLPKPNMEFLDLSFRDLPEERSKISMSYSDMAPAGSSSADSLLGICLQAKETSNARGKASPVDETMGYRHQFYEKDATCMLSKSFSEKVGSSNSYHKEREILKSSPKSLFSPFKKMLDPVMKSKTPRSPSLVEPGSTSTTPDTGSLCSRHKVFPRSLLNDFSKAAQKIDNGGESDQAIKTVTSPVHLHAILKWEFNHGGSSYEFSVKDHEDVLSAKAWKTENAFNLVYTFHCCKMKTNIISHGKKNRHHHPSFMIGQMQVSFYLCSEVNEAGSMDNSVVTEFTLYDIARARRSVTIERSHRPSDSNQTSSSSGSDCLVRRYSSELDSDPSTSYPWASAELQPNLEIATIVTQFPFTKKEALENMQARRYEDNCGNHDISSSYPADQTRVSIGGLSSPASVKVVTPSGRHGVPNREELGPSSLLDRWRFGGGCDCGGWDMGCPIVVFENANSDNMTSRVGTQQPTALFFQGKKEKVPALAITATGKGQYAVDFHAQLSTLQAFSICIAILHSSEASSAIGQDNNKYKIYSNNLKLVLEEEMSHIIEAVAEEKGKDKRKVEQTPPFFFLDPPISPMGRV